jgi:hypothetical protein
LHGHLPAGEIHKPPIKAQVLIMERGVQQGVVGHVAVRVRESRRKVNQGFTASDFLRVCLIPVS